MTNAKKCLCDKFECKDRAMWDICASPSFRMCNIYQEKVVTFLDGTNVRRYFEDRRGGYGKQTK